MWNECLQSTLIKLTTNIDFDVKEVNNSKAENSKSTLMVAQPRSSRQSINFNFLFFLKISAYMFLQFPPFSLTHF